MSIGQWISCEIFRNLTVENMNYLNCKWSKKGKKKYKKCYQKMEFFKFQNNNRLRVSANLFVVKFLAIFIHKI